MTDSGREYRFSVTDVEPDALVGEDVRVEFDEILLVERRETDVDRTLANLGEAGLVVVAVVAFVVVTTALSVFHHERL